MAPAPPFWKRSLTKDPKTADLQMQAFPRSHPTIFLWKSLSAGLGLATVAQIEKLWEVTRSSIPAESLSSPTNHDSSTFLSQSPSLSAPNATFRTKPRNTKIATETCPDRKCLFQTNFAEISQHFYFFSCSNNRAGLSVENC